MREVGDEWRMTRNQQTNGWSEAFHWLIASNSFHFEFVAMQYHIINVSIGASWYQCMKLSIFQILYYTAAFNTFYYSQLAHANVLLVQS